MSIIRPYLYSLLPENAIKSCSFIVDNLYNTVISFQSTVHGTVASTYHLNGLCIYPAAYVHQQLSFRWRNLRRIHMTWRIYVISSHLQRARSRSRKKCSWHEHPEQRAAFVTRHSRLRSYSIHYIVNGLLFIRVTGPRGTR
jgi:hypothetical protein